MSLNEILTLNNNIADRKGMEVYIFIWPKSEYCFLDVALTIRCTLRCNGFQCEIRNTLSTTVPTIILGANLIRGSQLSGPIGSNCIILNMEQMYDQSPWLGPAYVDLLKTHTVWDYNASNLEFLQKLLGREEIPLITLGYTPDLEFPCVCNEDIDVLFYGEINARRRWMEIHLQQAGIKSVIFRKDLKGSEKTILIARAKIVLNLHYYEASLFEIPRVYHLLHRKKFVITEESANLAEYDYLEGAFVVTPYDQMVTKVLEYLEKPEERKAIATFGYEKIKATPTFIPEIVMWTQ